MGRNDWVTPDTVGVVTFCAVPVAPVWNYPVESAPLTRVPSTRFLSSREDMAPRAGGAGRGLHLRVAPEIAQLNPSHRVLSLPGTSLPWLAVRASTPTSGPAPTTLWGLPTPGPPCAVLKPPPSCTHWTLPTAVCASCSFHTAQGKNWWPQKCSS